MASRLARSAALVLVLIGCAGNPEPAPPPVVSETPAPAVPTTPAPVASSTPTGGDAVMSSEAGAKTGVWPYQTPVVVRSAKGMVVSDNAIASNVGRDVLASGGNAADAAVAVAFALAVAYPTAGNIGGGGFAVTRMGGEVRALDFRETAPAAATRDMYLSPDGKPKPEAREGIKSAGVPGSVAGLWELHRTLGSKKKTWKELLAPAIKLAREGFVVDEAFLSTLEVGGKRLVKHPASAALFMPGGKPPEKGSTFKNPDLATVLERIEKGASGFYEGPTAAAIAQQMKEEGGLITLVDLKKYQAKWRKPIEFTYRGHKITSMPPPSSGGVTLAMIAHIVEGYELGKLGHQSPDHLHVVFEAMRRAYAARNAKLGDPDFVKMPLEELLSDKWAKEQRSTIKPDRATPSSEIVAAPASASGPHTTHFSVVDANGDAVALTTTVNWWYGSGVTVKGAGFVLNNEMDDFAAVPGTANGFGLVQGEANAIQPGKRMLSSMAPTIVTGPDGKVVLVAGGAGGPTIITAVFLQVSNMLDFNLDVGAAVNAPRFHMQHLPDEVMFEKDGLKEATAKRLEAMGYRMKERGHIADAPAIGRSGNEWIGAAEPRRIGGLAAAP
ncbi:gamma-glutamyltransferase [Polyangium aurulentum]|uniref:gamma-glutamyltransferase n=1 Tax=Polyangium aurulentum TaxID=2567896 RepID=UPI0010AE5C92|nr:gamma-glutamyltransferase [Polyangium aurulentum]UQA56901.1 gamma-glutamyltransferase [Polyangium aurulentum]